MLLKGNCLELLAEMPDNSVDSIVTDPPYELGFMGKSWDNSGIAYNVELWSQALRVLKPGGHLLAFGGSRTYHRLASAVEDAGFEIRDQIMWLYGSGFPKSLNVSKAIDKAAGAEREVVGSRPLTGNGKTMRSGFHQPDGTGAGETEKQDVFEFTAPATPEAQQWDGWGTALKPAHEPIVVARKPLIGTVANNVLTYGTGALNIDGSRVETTEKLSIGSNNRQNALINFGMKDNKETQEQNLQGRWPANVIHDGSEEVLEYFGEPQRFFYCAKASKSERNAGLEGLPEKKNSKMYRTANNTSDTISKGFERFDTAPQSNNHPTVKPIALMRYLVKLVTPPNGTVLDPFLGSGTTAVAAILEGFNWMGCEMTEDYWPIIEARVAWAELQPKTLL